jgi:hypothetical protein
MDFFLYILFALVWLGVGGLVVLGGSVCLYRTARPDQPVTVETIENDWGNERGLVKVMTVLWPLFLLVCILFWGSARFGKSFSGICRRVSSFSILPGRLIVWPPSRWGLKAKSPRD